MRFNQYIPAVVALSASAVSAQRNRCNDDITITQANAGQVIDCERVRGDIIIDSDVTGDLQINGPEEITGSLNATGASGLLSISSSTIRTIGGSLDIVDVPVNNVQLTALRSVETINLLRLNSLTGLTFGDSGSFEASNVEIVDTFINDLSGLRLTNVETLTITNNQGLRTFNSELVNVTGIMAMTGNGDDNLTVSMPDLRFVSDLRVSNVASFDAPSLRTAGSIRFNTNPSLESFRARNLTNVEDSLTFINNNALTNVSFPALTAIRGDLTVQNNTDFTELTGFPRLARVSSVLLFGTFEEVELPALEQVSGSVTVTSTTDISEFCNPFDEYKSSNVIQGEMSCTSNNEDALEGEDGGEDLRGDGNGNSSNDDDDDNAAGMVQVSSAVFAVALGAGLLQLL